MGGGKDSLLTLNREGERRGERVSSNFLLSKTTLPFEGSYYLSF
ncbi:MAG: hypothetical protein QW046_03755 [Candidatus Micrarchaeaceae archaeon]